MEFEALLALIRDSATIEIRTHENADADGVGASLALKSLIEELGKRPSLVAPGSISKLGRLLADVSQQALDTAEPSQPPDLVIFVDARPGPAWVSSSRVAVIDHHEAPAEIKADFVFVDPRFPSASEMVFEFLQYMLATGLTKSIPKHVAIMLLSGIIADTADLKLAVKETLSRVVQISTLSGVELKDVFPLLRTPLDRSLRMACLKGASRLKIKTVKGYFIASTHVSSYQGDVASNLMHLGADVAFAGGSRKRTLNVSGRARVELVEKGLSLARIMETIGSRMGGEGGGHPGAAALRCEGDLEEVLRICVAETEKAIDGFPEACAFQRKN